MKRYILLIILGFWLAACALPTDQVTVTKNMEASSVRYDKFSMSEVTAKAKAGNANAQYELSQRYRQNGDEYMATSWLKRAAVQGHAWAQNDLGFAYMYKKGEVKNSVLGLMWYSIAFQNGDNLAMENITNAHSRMSKADIEKAKRLKAQCLTSKYKNCGL